MKRLSIALLAAAAAAVVALLFQREAAPSPGAGAGTRSVQFVPPAEPQGGAAMPPGAGASAECNTLLKARFVDPAGRPVADARLQCAWPRGSATSGSDGRVTLALALLARSEVRTLHLRASAPGFANVVWTAQARDDETTELGDIVLGPAGRVVGRVLDEQGHGLAMAEVRAVAGAEDGGATRFHGPSDAVASVASAADGSFVLEGVPVGPARVWAGSASSFWSASGVLDVREGATAPDVTLVLRPIPAENVLELAVVGPEGEPIPGALIAYQRRGGRSPAIGQGLADEHGRWRLIAEERVAHDFRASEPEGRLRAGRIEGVEPGSGEIVIALGAPRSFRLVVRDAAGRGIEHFKAELVERAAFGSLVAASFPAERRPDGALEVSLPIEQFEVRVEAEGHRVATFGPFEPEAVGAELVVALAPIPRILGLVHVGGQPVANARVTLHAATPPNVALSINGFAARCEPIPAATGSTGPDGTFALTLRSKGTFFVRAAAAGYCAVDAGPIPLDGELGASGLNLELSSGGTLEGLVRVDPGESAAGRIVVASRGDGLPFSVRSDDEGRFRLEHLTPGRWWIGPHDRELAPGSYQAQRTASAAEVLIPANCEVAEGVTTRFDVSYEAVLRAFARGQLSLGGRAAEGWAVELRSSSGAPRALRRAGLDAQGRFEIGAPAAGEYVLAFHDPQRGASALTIDVTLTLGEGAQDWSLDLPLGRGQGRVLTFGEAERELLGWRLERADGVRAHGQLTVDADGSFVVPRLPAGELTFVRRDRDGSEAELKRVVLPVRATIDLEL